jgi:Holliday junction DNA helicase RuvA
LISHIKGRIDEIGVDHIVLDVQGVGFMVFMPARDIAETGRPGEEVRVYTEMVVREDFLGLYGFSTQFGRQMFNLLCTVNGIGPRIAMSVLSGSSPEKIAMAISIGDPKGVIAPGVGKKLADRLILELKGKVGPSGSLGGDGPVDLETTGEVSPAQDALKALISLGYTRMESESAVRKALKQDPSADAGRIIRLALGTFSGQ